MELTTDINENTLSEYCEGKINLSPLLNFLFGMHGRMDIEPIIYSALKNTEFKLKNKKRSFVFWTFLFNNSVNRYFLESKFKAIYHKKFGEGLKGCNPKVKNASYISFFARTDKGKVVHFGIDHRGTTMEMQTDFTKKEVKELIEWVIKNKIEFCPEEIRPYYEYFK